jgi:hypothetical protein
MPRKKIRDTWVFAAMAHRKPSETAAIAESSLDFLLLHNPSVMFSYIEGSLPLRRSSLGVVSNMGYSGFVTIVGTPSQVYTFFNWKV